VADFIVGAKDNAGGDATAVSTERLADVSGDDAHRLRTVTINRAAQSL
jgi:hypothetical protein